MRYVYECRHCGRQIARNAYVCRHCGYRSTSLFSIILASTVALLGIATMLAFNQQDAQAPVPIVSAAPTSAMNETSTKSAIERSRQLRKSFAAEFDRKMLEAHIESTTRTYGPDDTTLLINDALAGEARAKKVANALDFKLLNKLGFTKLVYTNGVEADLGTTFTWSIP